MANKFVKKDKSLAARKVIRVPFFNDEFEALGLSPDMSYFNAVGVIRNKTGCVIGARTRQSGVSKGALYTQFGAATEEQKKAIAKILGGN